MQRRFSKLALISGLLAIILSGCVNYPIHQGPKPSSKVTAVNGRSGNEVLIEEFRTFLREQSDGWVIDKTRASIALAEYVSIQDEEGTIFSLGYKYSLGYREWIAVCYSGEVSYVKVLTLSQLERLKDLIRRGAQTAGVNTTLSSVSEATQTERYNFLRSIWPKDSILTPTTSGARLMFVYTGVIDTATIRRAQDKYRQKFGEELLLESFGG